MSSIHYPTRVERDTSYSIKHSILPSKGQCNTSYNIGWFCNQLPQPHSMTYEFYTYFCAWHPLVLFLRTVLRGPRAEIISVFAVPPWRRAASASTMGCGGRMPTTQHIAVTLTPWATRRYAGSRAFDHHSHSKLTLMVPHFFVTFFNGMIIDN